MTEIMNQAERLTADKEAWIKLQRIVYQRGGPRALLAGGGKKKSVLALNDEKPDILSNGQLVRELLRQKTFYEAAKSQSPIR